METSLQKILFLPVSLYSFCILALTPISTCTALQQVWTEQMSNIFDKDNDGLISKIEYHRGFSNSMKNLEFEPNSACNTLREFCHIVNEWLQREMSLKVGQFGDFLRNYITEQ